MNTDIKPNPLVKLHEYLVIFDSSENDDISSTEIFLPNPESFQLLCTTQIMKNIIFFDLNKYKSFFITPKGPNSEKDKNILNLEMVPSLTNKDLLPLLLTFLGGINSINSIYDIFDNVGTSFQPKEDIYIDNSLNYLQYISLIIDLFKTVIKLSIPFSQMESLFKCLDELGINIPREDKNFLYRSIKDYFFSMENNKILILIAPSNNFWIKSEKTSINDINYDIKLNNYSNIFYNKIFIKNFLTKVSKHPRCTFGLISSMTYKNLKHCWDGLEKQFSKDCPKKVIFIDQKDHEYVMLEQNAKKKSFFRNMQKIIEHLKREKDNDLRNKKKCEDNENVNIKYFNEQNIIILESEEDKLGEDTKYNSFLTNLFSEQYLEYNDQQKTAIDLEGEKTINYLIKLLENCIDDVRNYLHDNKISNSDSQL